MARRAWQYSKPRKASIALQSVCMALFRAFAPHQKCPIEILKEAAVDLWGIRRARVQGMTAFTIGFFIVLDESDPHFRSLRAFRLHHNRSEHAVGCRQRLPKSIGWCGFTEGRDETCFVVGTLDDITRILQCAQAGTIDHQFFSADLSGLKILAQARSWWRCGAGGKNREGECRKEEELTHGKEPEKSPSSC